MQPQILNPNEILMTEEYTYQSKVSGVRYLKLASTPTGLITVRTPYDNYKLSTSASTSQQRRSVYFDGMVSRFAEPIGYLQCSHYGMSNFDREPDLPWEGDLLPLKITLSPSQLSRLNTNQHRRFDLQLTQTYQPNEPQPAPLEVSIFVVDEDSRAEEWESDRKRLVKELRKQADIKRSLSLKFRVKLTLPTQRPLVQECNTLPLKLVLQWPLATPHRLAKFSTGITPYPFTYNPENGTIECNNIPLRQRENQDLLTYATDLISLEVSEPIELYEMLKLQGSVSVEWDGLMSGLSLNYLAPADKEAGSIAIKQCTIVKNEFLMNLQEGLENKHYLPRQHLHFPRVVLNEMRVADIIMLLEDKGFEIEKLQEPDSQESVEKQPYIIKAKRAEGAREVKIFILIQGTSAQTSRERGVKGQAKFTTSLPVGDTSIYIQGRLPGDSKRIVNLINEIQKQLKEQFRHVGTAE